MKRAALASRGHDRTACVRGSRESPEAATHLHLWSRIGAGGGRVAAAGTGHLTTGLPSLGTAEMSMLTTSSVMVARQMSRPVPAFERSSSACPRLLEK